MSTDNRNDLAIALYTQAMEDLRHRARIEWQTFAVVNLVYAGGIKILVDIKSFSPFWGVLLTTGVLFFTIIWIMRLYCTARRTAFPRRMRNVIQEYARKELSTSISGCVPSPGISGGWPYWATKKIFPKEQPEGRSWPLWTYRGIIIAIGLYCITFLVILWAYKIEYTSKASLGWIALAVAISMVGALLVFLIDKKLIYEIPEDNGQS